MSIALLGGAPDGVGRGGGEPHRRVRRLHGLGQHLDAVVGPEPPLVGHALLSPGGQHDLHALAEAVRALLDGHAEGLELGAVEAAAGAPVHPAAGQHVDQGDLLGQPQRIVEGGQGHGHPDPERPRARGHVAGHHVDGRTHAVGVEVVLGQPHAVVAGLVHDLDAGEGPRVDLGQRDAPRPREELEHAHFHRPRSLHHAAWRGAYTSMPDSASMLGPHRRGRGLGRSGGRSDDGARPWPPDGKGGVTMKRIGGCDG